MFGLHLQKREGNNVQRQEASKESGHAEEMGRGSTVRKGYWWKITRLPVGGYQLDTFFLCPGNECNVLITNMQLKEQNLS